jgi:sigma-54 dependent transcriptional regulator, acetoin dehydrogenase operon transcriptional activator AcoR
MENKTRVDNNISPPDKNPSKDYIKSSHKRSKEYGVELGRMFSTKILRGNELEEKMAENKELIEATSPFLRQLCDFVKGSGFFAILTDWEGCILDIQGDDDVLSEALSLEMIPGAFMHEKHIGTNAMGTALVEKVPVQISGDEHYVTVYHRWMCSAAPIRDTKGRIIGTLDLTGQSDIVNSHTLGMVVAAVNAIEQMLIIRQSNQKLELARNSINTIIDSITAGIFTIGPKGYLKTINKTAEEMLGYKQSEIKGLHISKIVDYWDNIEKDIDKGINYTEEELSIKCKNGKRQCAFSTYPINHNGGQHSGVVCVIKEVRKIRKIAHKIAGCRAVYTFDKIIGRNQKFLELIDYARNISNSPSTVLISGESGVGKELFAQAIHNASGRREEAFVAINCGAIPRTLIESELFGYEDGAFTGAKRGGQLGKFEWADGGTLFLDEIGEMSYDMQTNLLRVLETGKLFRVGGNKEIDVDVRIIAATNKDLREEVNNGNFRKDLYYRLNVVPLEIMPLCERKDDISLLIDYFITIKSIKIGKNPVTLTQAQLDQLINYRWPGNVRELENIVEQIINLNTCSLWREAPYHIPTQVASAESSEGLDGLERAHIEKIFKSYNCNVTLAAEALGIARNTFYRKMKKYDIGNTKS